MRAIAHGQDGQLTARRLRDNNPTQVAGEETIGARVRRIRLARGMSQRALSGPGVSYAYVSRIEAGKRNPSVKAIRLLARKLGVTADYLETGERIPEAKERELRIADAELELRLDRDVERAEAIFSAVIDEQPGSASEARARAALGILASRRGHNAQALRQLEAAIDSPSISPERRSDVYETLARVYLAIGTPSNALILLERCLEHVTEHAPDDATLQVRYRTFLGETFSALGQLDRARDLLAEAVERAEGYTLPSARVALYWSHARVAWMQADSDAALDYVARAIGLLDASDDTMQLARAHLLSAQISNLDGRPTEAGRHLAQADRLLALGSDSDDIGILRAEQAKHAAKNGQPRRALALAREAVSALEGDARFAATAWHALAVAQASAGDLQAAESTFGRALDRLTERRQWREAAVTARDWSAALREAGREAEAYDLLERALFLELREKGAGATKS
jgi:transcriptional regulator with XRE-family HTH domain